MALSKSIRCERCQVVMCVRHYVLVHRKDQPGVGCPAVPCEVCGGPVPKYGLTAFGDAVCSTGCFSRHRGYSRMPEVFRNLRDQLRAMRRAQKLPPVYERARAS